MIPPTTELRPAFEWICEECGRNQFESCVVADFPMEDMLEMAREEGLIGEFDTEMPDGNFLSAPLTVQCPDCGSEYITTFMDES